MPPRDVRGPARSRKPTRGEKPAPASVFGALHRADAPITRAQKLAGNRVQRAQTRLPQRVLPAVPTLAHPTRQQARTAVELGNRAVARVPVAARGELAQDPRTAARLAPVKRSQAVIEHNLAVHAGMVELHRNPGAYGIEPKQLAALHKAAVENRIPEATRAQIAQIGRGVAAGHRAQIKPGVHREISAAGATVDLTNVGHALSHATTLGTAELGPRHLLQRSLKDLATIGESPVLGGYQVGRGLEELAVHRDPSRLKRLGSGVAESVKQEFTHPGTAFTEHPLLTTLDAAATLTVGGRLAGAATRLGTAGRLGSTVRSPLALVDDAGTQILHERTSSKDLLRSMVQSGFDARREPVLDLKGRPMTVTDRGRTVPVLRATETEAARLLRRRGNFAAARANAAERLVREVGQREGRVKGIRGKAARDLVAMGVEGTITTAQHFKRDLEAHANRLEREYRQRTQAEPGYRHTGEADAALRRIQFTRAAALDPRVLRQADKIMAAAEHHGRRLREGDKSLVGREILTHESAYRSPLIVTAIEHMGGRHFSVDAHRKLERDAAVRERAAAQEARDATGPAKQTAVARYHAARAERIAVSGRHPEQLKAHEEARGRVVKAEQAVRDAKAEQLQAHNQAARLGGAQSVQRGREAAARMQVASRGGRRSHNVLRYIDEVSGDQPRLTRGAALERRMERERATAQDRLKTAKLKRQRAEKALRQERHRLRENPMPETKAGVRTAEGKFLSNRDIENFLRSRGRDPQTVGFLPHVLPRESELFGRRAHHTQFRPGSRPDLDSGPSRTGEAYRKGATEASAQLLRDQGVRQVTLLSKAEQLDSLVGEHGLRHPAWGKAQRGEQLTRQEQRVVDRGGYFTGAEAAELADRVATDTRTGHTVLTTKGGQELVPLRAHGGRLDAETQRIIREDLQGPGAMETLPQRLLNDRVLSPDELGRSRTRNIVLAPKALIDQLERHLRPAGELERMLQMLNKPFRMAVLPQPRWLTGNFVEPYLVRLPTIGSGAINVFGLGLDIYAATKAVRRMERSGNPALRQLAKEIRAQQFGGLFIGGRGASNLRTRDQFEAYARLVAKVPAVENLGNVGSWVLRNALKPLDAYFKVNRTLIEAPAQRAAFGRQLRHDIQEFTGNWFETVRLGNRAVDEASRGLLNTATQRRFMAMQHELLGQYEGYGPRMRSIIQGPMPFLPWALSAARFVYWTMPMHRTAQTALLIKTQDVVSKAWADEHKDAPPGGLQLAARTPQGGFVDFARYTPYGLTGPVVEGDPQGVTDQFMPQVSSLVSAASGNDPFGRPLQGPRTAGNPQGKVSKVGAGAYGLLESLVPYLSTIRRLREHGATPYSNSTAWSPKTKPGTAHGMSGLRRTFDPFRPTYLKSGPAVGGGVHVKGSYWQRSAAATGAHSASAVPDESYWRSLAAGGR